MSEPFIFVSTYGIKQGKLEDNRRSAGEVVGIAKANEPQLIAFHIFLNEDGPEVTNVQVNRDAASMDNHLQVLRENLGEAMGEWAQLIEPVHIEYYGPPSASALEMDRQIEGLALSLKPIHMAGFTRSTAG